MIKLFWEGDGATKFDVEAKPLKTLFKNVCLYTYAELIVKL